MTSNLKYTNDYTELGHIYQLVLPLSLDGLVPVDPKTMFKILTYAYSQNIYSSRRIETAREDLFYQMVKRLADAGELSMGTVLIDGTKIESCANKYTFVWKKSVGKWKEKMFQKLQEAVEAINYEYMQSFSVKEESRTQDLKVICRYLEDVCIQRNVQFVHG